MKITALETISAAEFENLLWLKVHTDEGIVGPRRNLLHASRGRSLCARNPRPEADRPRPARHRPDRQGCRRLHRVPLERGGDARQLGARHRAVGYPGQDHRPADRPAARRLLARLDPHLQHLRRADLHAAQHRTASRKLRHRADGGALRRPQRLSGAGRRSGRGSSVRRHHGHEDLALRRASRTKRRALYLGRRSERRVAALREDPQACRRPHGRDGRVPFHVAAPPRHADRTGARALRHVLARRPDQDGQPRLAQALCRSLDRADLRLRNARHPVGLSRPPGNRRGRRGHARPFVVRRHLGGQEDRHHGRGLASARRPARLHRAGGARSLHAPVAQCAQRARPGKRSGLLQDLVPRSRDRGSACRERLHHRAERPRPGIGTRARSRSTLHTSRPASRTRPDQTGPFAHTGGNQ